MTGSCLVYGYGNPGRQDDGLGPALVEDLDAWLPEALRPRVTLDSNYQLNAEDALAIAGQDTVIFADAAVGEGEPFSFRRLEPEATIAFSTHAMSPATVLALCEELYGKRPDAYLLTIRGYSWEPNAPMTPAAAANLAAAREFLRQFLQGHAPSVHGGG